MAKKSKLGFGSKNKETITSKIIKGYTNPKKKTSARGHRKNIYK